MENEDFFDWDSEIQADEPGNQDRTESKAANTTSSQDIPEAEHNEMKIEAALSAIPCDNYEIWANVGMGLKNEGYPLSLWEEWSQNSSKYKPGNCAKKWDSFNRKGINIDTIIYYALDENKEQYLAELRRMEEAWQGTGTPAPRTKTNVTKKAQEPKKAKDDMTFVCYFDPESFTHKPDGEKDATRIVAREPQIINGKVTLEEFKKKVENGQTFIPCACKKLEKDTGNGKHEPIEQQIFVVDIDNEEKGVPIDKPITFEQIKKKCDAAGVRPFYVYETFSSKYHRDDIEHPYKKFRVCFALNEPIKASEWGSKGLEQVRTFFFNVFGVTGKQGNIITKGIDRSIRNPGRLIYATDEKDPVYSGAFLNDTKEILDKVKTWKPAPEEQDENPTPSIQELKDKFLEWRESPNSAISTGFMGLDRALSGGFMQELYVMAAETGIGKSAIAIALAENLARNGHQVLYFALEMSENEIIARGIAAESKRGEDNSLEGKPIPFSWILNGREEKDKDNKPSGIFKKVPFYEFSRAAERYFDSSISRNLHIIECGTTDTTAQEICETVRTFKKNHNTENVFVFVDYLQIIAGDKKDPDQHDTMGKMNIATKKFKSLASQEGATVFLLSSTANDKKGERVHELSAKYSGDIGYTAGVFIGMNWEGVTTLHEGEERKQNLYNDENTYHFREITLEIVKNRNGLRGAKTTLRYFPAYNYVTEKELEKTSAQELKEARTQGFSTTTKKNIRKQEKAENDFVTDVTEAMRRNKSDRIELAELSRTLAIPVTQVRKLLGTCSKHFDIEDVIDENGEKTIIKFATLNFEDTKE